MGQLHAYLLVLLLFGYGSAGPVREETAEETKPDENVCEVKNVTYARGDVVPDVAPCETCVCQPPEVKCTPNKCQTNNGCKILQQSGKCCPEYKCDCEHEGTTYNNGEKLHNPSSPCQVCYCRGGEIMCNSITCYRRDDCEPQHVEGQCCPKYGHCPPKNSSSVVAVPADPSGLSTKREMQPWLLTKSVNLQTTETPSKYPQTIKIVEILPTQAPSRSGEVSLVPRIITNGSPERVSAEPSTPSYSESPTNVAEPLKISPEREEGQPDSETYTTLLPQMVDVTTGYEELSVDSGLTEGTGYDLESGGTFFPNATDDDSSEENGSKEQSTTALPADEDNPKYEVEEPFDTTNQTANANLELDPENTTLAEDATDLPETSDATPGLITRHGLTIPPILNLNHQLHHLTLGGTGEDAEEKSVVRIGVYNPTMPGEVSNMVTVIKNEDTASSANSATTQLLLTPQDLKTLAEMIIKEKIKAPSEKLLATTPLPTSSYDETTGVSPELLADNETAADVEETTPHVSSKKPLTKEEEKAQAVIDKLTSNIHLPLQGIELVDANDTTTADPVEVLPSNDTEIPNNRDAEWVEVSNSTKQEDNVVNEDDTIGNADNATTEVDSKSTESADEVTTELQTSTAVIDSTTNIPTDVSPESGKSRGSLRQMEDLVSQLPDDHTDRRTRITATNDHSKQISMAMFDEKDQMLVENFFKKALDFQ